MITKKLILALLLLVNTSLFSMDMNKTIVIIEEATKATEILQNEFDILINEEIIPNKEQKPTPPIDSNSTPNIEINTTVIMLSPEIYEINQSIELNESIIMNELNSSKHLSCNDMNNTVLINGLNINLDENNTISDNGCTDSNLGTSAEGLIIFKTRIKPYCEIDGEKFAKQYMQEDWEDIYHEKEFKMEVIKACPKVEKRYKDTWTPHLYQFTIEYASDSDAIPEC